ncbi:glycoside hydrolase family 2 protein [Seonamhaeicola algicola]|uniref:Beta-mannosidase B n=1 Tax=Seonamhaeicola algicola TaxID=1719036 RepID=A0A5C7B2D5_9FLAO|nr:glycoside hydrolase family 2 protein [Seonamhaeicola algicola]TXE15058.1 glycoside hydrolase family 2 protein [Seonamhaeicola algicola]
MKTLYFKLLSITTILLFFASCKTYQKSQTKIHENWLFKAEKDTSWLKAKVPGTVHTDLLSNNIITNPFYRTNEKQLQWIDKNDWEYKTFFEIDKATLKKEKVEIEFKGLDTYASIFLNDSLVSRTDNMFVGHTINAKPYLKLGSNNLKIVFNSPIKKGLEKRDVLGYRLPNAVNDQSENGGLGKKQVAVFSRKPGYHFGWDWGPRLVTSGIWKDVNLHAWNKAIIRDTYIKQEEIAPDKAILNAELEIEAITAQATIINIKVDNNTVVKKAINLSKGLNRIKIPFTIKNPKLWWTNGLGTQKLYNVAVELKKGRKLISSEEKKIGLKTLKVVQNKDEYGESFYFELNEQPVFMKGANYIPQDVFLTRVTVEDYEQIIKDMVDANYNMIRVWGGGIYEKDIFYDLCDKYGILVWQDFMFACAMYPGDKAFLNTVKEEAIYNVKRLRNHTCIALWCGNNENLTAWKNWGWIPEVLNSQGQEVVDKIWKGYKNVFHKILPDVVEAFDNDTFYWASSPTSARGEDATLTSGDYHYWGVWGQQEPFSAFNEYIPRFMSEYGFQSFPEFSSVAKFTTKEDWNIYSEVMKSHQRHPIGNKNIEHYMEPWYKKPKDFESFLYVSQLLQAKGMQIAIEAHRRNMPYCMGSLYWQINDCWPVASWSTIDYYGNWKAAHYKVKDLYKPIKVMFYENEKKLEVHIVSDKLKDEKAHLKLSILDFEGKVIKTFTEAITIKANTSAIYFSKNISALISEEEKNKTVVVAELIGSYNKAFDESIHYFTTPKDLELAKAKIDFTILKVENNNITIEVKTNTLAKSVRLTTDVSGRFSNNYFDIIPNKAYHINFNSDKKIDAEKFKSSLKIISLINTYKNSNEAIISN